MFRTPYRISFFSIVALSLMVLFLVNQCGEESSNTPVVTSSTTADPCESPQFIQESPFTITPTATTRPANFETPDCIDGDSNVHLVQYIPYSNAVKVTLKPTVPDVTDQARFSVMTGVCGELTMEACSKFGEEVSLSIVEGKPFYIAFQERSDEVTIHVEEFYSGPGDSCANPDPQVIKLGSDNVLSPRSEIKSGYVSCFADSVIGWHWYSYTLSAANQICTFKTSEEVPVSLFTDCSTEFLCNASLASVPATIPVDEPGGTLYFALPSAGVDSLNTYHVTITEPIVTTLFNEGFETFPFEKMKIVEELPTWGEYLTEWKQVSETEYPNGGNPIEGDYFAYCVVNEAKSNSVATLESIDWLEVPNTFDNVRLFLDVYHDNNPQYKNNDRIEFQISYDQTTTWEALNLGNPIKRFIGVNSETSLGWKTYSIDLNLALGKWVKFRILGAVETGKSMKTGIYIDHVRVEGYSELK